MQALILAETVTGRHIAAVRQWAVTNHKKALVKACAAADRKGRGGLPNFAALRKVADAYNCHLIAE